MKLARFYRAACCALIVQSTLAVAQSYPTKPITLVVGYPPGGSVDLACRRLGLAYGAEDGGPELLALVNGRLYAARAEATAPRPSADRVPAEPLRVEMALPSQPVPLPPPPFCPRGRNTQGRSC